MIKKLVLTFVDELGKYRRIMINDPIDDINADKADAVAKVIVESNAFTKKGLFREFIQADVITTRKERIVDHRA